MDLGQPVRKRRAPGTCMSTQNSATRPSRPDSQQYLADGFSRCDGMCCCPAAVRCMGERNIVVVVGWHKSL
jgi:hypothetical protein